MGYSFFGGLRRKKIDQMYCLLLKKIAEKYRLFITASSSLVLMKQSGPLGQEGVHSRSDLRHNPRSYTAQPKELYDTIHRVVRHNLRGWVRHNPRSFTTQSKELYGTIQAVGATRAVHDTAPLAARSHKKPLTRPRALVVSTALFQPWQA